MALSNELLNFTSPIVDRAVKPGGWGRTIKKNDPSVVADALFKRAQLDLGIANLQQDFGLQSASILGNLGMKQADISLSTANINFGQEMAHRELAFKEFELRTELEKQDVGWFESVMGTIAGAAEGAVGGFLVGGPVGAVVGGVAGGAITGAGYASEGRQGGQAAQRMIGTVANAGAAIKGMVQQQSAKDGAQSLLQEGISLVRDMFSGDAQTSLAAGQKWDQHLLNFQQQQIASGINPQQAMQNTQDYAASMMKSGQTTAAHRRQVEFAANPEPTIEETKDYMADQMMNYANAHGGKEMPEALVAASVESAHPGLMGKYFGEGSPQTGVEQQAPATGTPMRPPSQPPAPTQQSGMRTREAPAEVGGQQAGQVAPQQGRSIRQAPQQQSAPVQGRRPSLMATPKGPSLKMDDGKPAQAEQELAKQGGETVDALKERDWKDKLLHGGRVPVIGGMPGLIDSSGIKEDAEREIAETKALVFKDGKNAAQVKDEVYKTLEKVTPRTEEGRIKKQGLLNSAYYAEKLEKSLEKLPLDEFFARAHAEGVSAEEAATVAAMVFGWGMGAKAAKGAKVAGGVSSGAAKVTAEAAAKAATSASKLAKSEQIVQGLEQALAAASKAEAPTIAAKLSSAKTAMEAAKVAASEGSAALGAAKAGAAGAGEKALLFRDQAGQLFLRSPIGKATIAVSEGVIKAMSAVGLTQVLRLGNIDNLDPLVRPLTKGKGIGLSKDEAAAVDSFTDSMRGLAISNLQAEFGRTPGEDAITAEMKSMIGITDNAKARWTKFKSNLEDIEDSAKSFAETYQHDVPMGVRKSQPTDMSRWVQEERIKSEFRRSEKEAEKQKKKWWLKIR